MHSLVTHAPTRAANAHGLPRREARHARNLHHYDTARGACALLRRSAMGWNVGTVNPALTYSYAVDGRLFVEGISIAGRGGWIHVRRPASGSDDADLATVSIRICIRHATSDSATLFIDEILSSCRCDEVEAARESWNGSELACRFARAVLDEFESRVARARLLAAGRTASDLRDRHDSVCKE